MAHKGTAHAVLGGPASRNGVRGGGKVLHTARYGRVPFAETRFRTFFAWLLIVFRTLRVQNHQLCEVGPVLVS